MKTSLSKTEQIRKILIDTPKIPPKQVAEMVGCPVQTVYQTRSSMKKKKKPVVQKIKVKTTVDSSARVQAMSREIEELKETVAGLRTVISYLEFHLGLDSSQ
jgi:metal-sulfur cluster biosynthetic enzyme